VSGLVEGVYTFELTVTDDKGATSKDAVTVTVNAAPNQAPVANAGTDQIITLPVNSVTLNGSGTDSDGNITSYRWTKTSGPASFTIVSPNSATTLVSGLAEGVYTFELTVTDNRGATGKATVKVTVNPAAPAPKAPNQAPVANAGANQTITLPVNSVTLTGSGTDNDGTIVSYKWAKTAGPSSFTFSNANAATTTVSGLVEGVYTFELTVTDNKGATGKATMNVTVNKAPNKAPVANAGADKTVTAPVTEVELDGSASYDPDGTIVKYEWIKISGDNPFTIFQSNTAKPTISNLPEGEYVLELTVTDNEGATAKDQVKVTVLAPPPVVQPDPVLKAEAGVSQTVMLPNTTTLLDGSASQGKITQILWRQISGPSVALMGSPTKLTTPVSNLIAGDYVFELTVKNDKGQTDVASVTVSVVYNNLRYSESIEIYPNPVQSILNYRFFTDEIKERLVLSLMDLNGKKVINDITIYKETTLYSGQMNLGFLQSGIYILEIRKEDGTRIVKKILKD
jgi:hypothetical protein